ncbi:hypothetical protein [Ornithinimicrobium sufpigmenti]|uniref:hypothetical protein n=1 Tax=Ornithinimicrobium sufpigmenti TaxID=2508882 RepID=UPI00307C807A
MDDADEPVDAVDDVVGVVDLGASFVDGLAADDSDFAPPASEEEPDVEAADLSPEDPDEEPDPRESVR